MAAVVLEAAAEEAGMVVDRFAQVPFATRLQRCSSRNCCKHKSHNELWRMWVGRRLHTSVLHLPCPLACRLLHHHHHPTAASWWRSEASLRGAMAEVPSESKSCTERKRSMGSELQRTEHCRRMHMHGRCFRRPAACMAAGPHTQPRGGRSRSGPSAHAWQAPSRPPRA